MNNIILAFTKNDFLPDDIQTTSALLCAPGARTCPSRGPEATVFVKIRRGAKRNGPKPEAERAWIKCKVQFTIIETSTGP